jgi:LacI family transcriptional regulator
MLVAIRELGLACPRSVSIVGFDDFEWSAYLDPPLTMVRQPAAELGTTAAQTLLKRIRHTDPRHCEKVLLPTQLVVRGSTARLKKSS